LSYTDVDPDGKEGTAARFFDAQCAAGYAPCRSFPAARNRKKEDS